MRDRLRAELTMAMKVQDRSRISALRSALSAIDNAEAVPSTGSSEGTIGHADVPRRSLDDGEVLDLITGEITERETSAGEYLALGLTEQAGLLQQEADVLREYLRDT